MISFEEYTRFDGIGLAEAIKNGEVPAREVLETAVEISRKLNPHLGAIITWMEDEAERWLKKLLEGRSEEGSRLDRENMPFFCVPTLLKDMEQAYPGVPMTDGSKLLRDFIPTYEGEFVKRTREKGGFIIFGKTNTSEFGLVAYTEPDGFPACRNPWDLELTPGGSSGGSASAVAAGMVPVASASDGGGSIRIPACYTGLFGLKPSRGRTPAGPMMGELWQGFALNFFLTKSVRDSAYLLDVVSGPETSSPFRIESPPEPYSKIFMKEPKKLRVAFSTKPPVGEKVDDIYVRAVEFAVRWFEELGFDVREDAPEISGDDILDVFLTMYYGETAALIKMLREIFGDRVFEEVEAQTLSLYSIGESFTAGDYVRSTWKRYMITRVLNEFFERYDIFITPTVARTPAKIGELKPDELTNFFMRLSARLKLGGVIRKLPIYRELVIANFGRTPFTQLANMTGVPAASVPVFLDGEKIPSAFQIIAPFGREDIILQVARMWEEAHPWIQNFPPPEIKKII